MEQVYTYFVYVEEETHARQSVLPFKRKGWDIQCQNRPSPYKRDGFTTIRITTTDDLHTMSGRLGTDIPNVAAVNIHETDHLMYFVEITDWWNAYQNREFTVGWCKTYHAHGEVTITAFSRAEAEEIVLSDIGDYEGTMRYDPNGDEITSVLENKKV